MEEDIKNMSKEELLEYLEEISQQLDNIALDQIKIAIAELQYFKDQYKQLEEENRTLKRANSIAEEVSIKDITQVMNKAYEDFMKEFIPTSLVKEKIEELEGTEELLSDEQGYWVVVIY